MSQGRLQPGDVLDGRYQIEGQLGEGGFSVVFRARQLTTGQTVAIKLLRDERLEGQEKRQSHIARFRREMKMIARLSHAHIVRLLDSGQIGEDGLYTVLEFVKGQSLADVLALEGRLKASEAQRLMGQVLDALSCAHSHGVVHRDLKPENIMVSASGARRSALVLDFGISGIVRSVWEEEVDSITQTGEFYGTPCYMAPEQLMGERPTVQTDLYAWGLVFLECLTGVRVVDGPSIAAIMSRHLSPQPIEQPAVVAAHPLGALLRQALEKDHRRRIASAAQLLELLEALDLSGLEERLQGEKTLEIEGAAAGDTWGSEAFFGEAPAPPKKPGKLCWTCGVPNSATSRFCVDCGKPFRPLCPSCNAEITAQMRFCQECGQALVSVDGASTRSQPMPPPPEPPPEPRPRPGRRSTRAENRQVTLLCVDFQVLDAAADPEDNLELLHAFRERLNAAVEAAGGRVIRREVGQAEICFGFPDAQEDDIRRAVRLALRLQAEVREMDQANHHTLCLRAGLATGEAVCELDTHTGVIEILGQARHAATRLCEATRRQILITEATRRLLQGYFQVQAVAAIDGEQPVFEVLGEGAQSQTWASPMVGRSQEVALLEGLWAQVVEGHGQAALVVGEPGMGKTRLLESLRDPAHHQQITWWGARCAPELLSSPYQPILQWLSDGAGLTVGMSADQRRAALEALARRAQVPEVTPWLAAAFGLGRDGELPPMGPARHRAMTQSALLSLITRLAERAPLALVLEDLQWADPSTLELIGALVEQAPLSPLLVLITARFTASLPWSPDALVTRVQLGRLNRAQVEAMIQQTLGGHDLPARVYALIHERADGIPLYVEELLRMMLEADFLTLRDGRYVLDGELPTQDIPATLRDLLTARLDRLGEARETALLCSVLGKEFSRALLEAVSTLSPSALADHLEQLQRGGFLYARLRHSQEVLVHRHALLQENAYSLLLRSQRREHHLRAARALEERFPALVSDRPELVAQHYQRAGHGLEALPYWQRAGAQAAARSANQEAIHHFRRGLELVRGLADPEAELARELELLVGLGTPLVATQGYAAAEVAEVYGRARELCQRLGATPRIFPVLWGLWVFYHTRAQLGTARELAEELMRLADASGEEGDRLEALAALGATRFCQGELQEGTELLMEGATLYRRERHHALAFLFGHDPGVFCRAHAAWGLQLLGRVEAAQQQAREAVELAEALKHPNSLALALHFEAARYQMNRQHAEARRCAQAQVTLAGEEVLPFWLAGGAAWSAWADLSEGDEGALGALQEAIGRWRGIGAELVRPHFMALLAEAHLNARRYEAAERTLEDALALSASTGERYYEPELLRLRALVLQARGALGQAEVGLWEAIERADAVKARALALRAALDLLRLERAANLNGAARGFLARQVAASSAQSRSPDLDAARALLASP